MSQKNGNHQIKAFIAFLINERHVLVKCSIDNAQKLYDQQEIPVEKPSVQKKKRMPCEREEDACFPSGEEIDCCMFETVD